MKPDVHFTIMILWVRRTCILMSFSSTSEHSNPPRDVGGSYVQPVWWGPAVAQGQQEETGQATWGNHEEVSGHRSQKHQEEASEHEGKYEADMMY